MHVGELLAERFELSSLAQAGGMGAVYRAHDRHQGVDVAVKLLRASGEAAESRFLREASLLAQLRHPAIVRHVAHGRTPAGELYLAMEWLEGEDLAHRLRRGPLAPGDALAVLTRAAEALSVLHARGGVHRDLKPGNLFLVAGEASQLKLLDFGIARATAHAMTLTRTGVLIGTPGYTAPEQARGQRDVDARADMFSLGAVLYECLAGRPAFVGEHVMAVLARILLEEPPRLAELVPGTPAGLEALTMRLLAKDPAARPAHAGELLELVSALSLGPLAHTTGPLAPRPPQLGAEEQRFMCLVLAADVERGTVAAVRVASLDTLDDPGAQAAAQSEPTLVPPSAGHEPLAALVAAHGARLDRLADGSWVVTPARGAATDQAAQAARCALALKHALPGARVAIASGRGVQAGRLPVGEVIDRALAGLGPAQARRPGVGLDQLTAALLPAGFERRQDDGVWRLLGERDEEELGPRVLGRLVPCIGRERELGTLLGLFDECASEPTARVALVRAPAGHGKSRLRDELHARLRARGEAFEWLFARGDPMRAGAPFALAAQLVRRAAGFAPHESAADKRARLLARLHGVPAAERARVAAFLAELCLVPAEDSTPALAAARRDAQVMGDQIRRAFEDFLAGECGRAPVVLVLDDLQLGDLPSIRLVDAALRHLRDRPLFVLVLARPEVHELFPGLFAERQLQELPLPELSRRAAGKIAREILGAEVADAVVERVVAQAGGNAFYLEELCRVVSERAGSELPGSVLAMVQARLDALGGAARRVLRAASIFGDRFPRAGVQRLHGEGPVDALLDELVERELLERCASAGELAFRHGLLREASYAMLTTADRTLGHALAAEHLEASGENDQVLLAEHHLRGGHPERAVLGFARAAREALKGNDLAAVLDRTSRGLGAGARGEALGELLALRAEAHRWRADYVSAAEAAQLAMAALPAGGAAWCGSATVALSSLAGLLAEGRLDALLARVRDAPRVPGALAERLHMLARGAVQLYLLGRYPTGDELVAQIDAERGEIELDPATQARVHEAHAFREGARAEQGRALELLTAAAACFDRAGDLRNASMARNNLGYTYTQLGEYEHAMAVLEVTLREAERVGIPFVATIVRQNLGLAVARAGDLVRGEELEREALAAFQRQGDHHMAGICRVYLAELRAAAGDLPGSEREATAAIEALAGSPPARALAQALLARGRIAAGQPEAALAPAGEAYALLEALGGLDEGEMLVRLAHAEALAANGRGDQAVAVARAAATRLAELAGKLTDDGLRRSYLERVAENARLLVLAT